MSHFVGDSKVVPKEELVMAKKSESDTFGYWIVGQEILDKKYIINGRSENLKNSSYDLTIGEIFPVGKAGYEEKKATSVPRYALRPREAVWILSKEEFRLPSYITSLATLRTGFTRQGLVAFNVGIIDPFYEGPISTVLLNFSKRTVEIEVGEKFFRTIFFKHSDVTEYKPKIPEAQSLEQYRKDLTTVALNDYAKNFLDIPEFDDDLYFKASSRLFKNFVFRHKTLSVLLFLLFAGPLYYSWNQIIFTTSFLDWVKTGQEIVEDPTKIRSDGDLSESSATNGPNGS